MSADDFGTYWIEGKEEAITAIQAKITEAYEKGVQVGAHGMSTPLGN